jgi:hypothetical protein
MPRAIKLFIDVLVFLGLLAVVAWGYQNRSALRSTILSRDLDSRLQAIVPERSEAHPVTPPVVDDPAPSPPHR